MVVANDNEHSQLWFGGMARVCVDEGTGNSMIESLGGWVERAGGAAERLLEIDLRLGVTGLRRAGKTVFTTAVIEGLRRGGRLPFLDVVSSGRFIGARSRPQPDHDVPRFAIEEHLAALGADEPRWPEATTGVGQARVSVRFRPRSLWRRAVGTHATLNLDIVDYPGEWLLDLSLLDLDFATWSASAIASTERPTGTAASVDWRAWLGTVDPAAAAEEEEARRGAALFTDNLRAARDAGVGVADLRPGRFLEPGDLKDAPLLTFCPLSGPARASGSLWALMAERFEAYKERVVRRFFADHFARIDRQIVLVDVLGALTAGRAAVEDTRRALEMCLEPFRHGSGGPLDRLLGRRIDKVLFAATKVDHVPSSDHRALTRILEGMIADARTAIRFDGAEVETMAIASVKCAETVTVERDGRTLRCVRGVPMGRDRPTVLFPGEFPRDLDPVRVAEAGGLRFIDFRPPAGSTSDPRGLPHIRLDQALNFLIGDRFE